MQTFGLFISFYLLAKNKKLTFFVKKKVNTSETFFQNRHIFSSIYLLVNKFVSFVRDSSDAFINLVR